MTSMTERLGGLHDFTSPEQDVPADPPFSYLFRRRLVYLALLGLALSVLCSKGVHIRRYDAFHFNAFVYNLHTLDPWNLLSNNGWLDSLRTNQLYLRALYTLSESRVVFGCLAAAMYLFSVWLRVYAVTYLAENLFRSKATGVLAGVLVSTNILFVSLGNTPYEPLAWICPASISHGFWLFALAAMLAARPFVAAACLSLTFLIGPHVTIVHGLALVATLPWMIQRCGVRRFLGALALLVIVGIPQIAQMLQTALIEVGEASVLGHERAMIQFKRQYFHLSLFWYCRQHPVEALYAAGFIPLLIAGVAGVKNRSARWAFGGFMTLVVVQAVLASILVQQGVSLAAKGQFARSVHWANALFPLFYAGLIVRSAGRSPWLMAAGAMLVFSVLVVRPDVHEISMHAVVFFAAPTVLYAARWLLKAARLPLAAPILATLVVGAVLLALFKEAWSPRMAVLFAAGLGAVFAATQLRQIARRPYVPAGVSVVWIAVALKWFWMPSVFPPPLKSPVDWVAEEPRALYEWVNRTPPDTVFLSPFYDSQWYRHAKRRSLITKYLPTSLVYSNRRIAERAGLLKDTGIWELLDFRYPEGIWQDEREYLEQAWKNLSEDRICRLAGEYGVSYVIREKELPLEFPIAAVVHDPELVIYDVTGMSAAKSEQHAASGENADAHPTRAGK